MDELRGSAAPDKAGLEVQLGHAGEILDMAFSPDGQFLATGSADRTAHLWGLRTWTRKLVFRCESGPVNSLAFSPDSQLLATACVSRIVTLFSVRTGALVRKLEVPGIVANVRFSPDGRWIAGAGNGVFLWDARTGIRILTLPDATWPLTFPDHRTMVTAERHPRGGLSLRLALWDISSGEPRRRIAVDQPRFGPESDLGPRGLVAIRNCLRRRIPTSELHQWRFSAPLRSFRLRLPAVSWSPRMSPNGKLLTLRTGEWLEIRKARSGALIRRIRLPPGSGGRAAFSPDGRLLAVSGRHDDVGLVSGEARVYSARSGKLIRSIAGQNDLIGGLSFSPNGSMLASTCRDGSVKLWDVRAGRLSAVLSARGRADGAYFSRDGAALIFGEPVSIWNPKSRRVARLLDGRPPFALSLDGMLLAAGHTMSVPDGSESYDVKSTRLYDLRTGRLFRSVDASGLITPDAREVVVGEYPGYDWHSRELPRRTDLTFHELRTGTVTRLWRIDGSYRPLCFAPDSRSLLTIESRKLEGNQHEFRAQIHNTSNGRLLRELRPTSQDPETAAFSPDGRLIAVSLSSGKMDRLTGTRWDGSIVPGVVDIFAEKEDPICRLSGHAAPVSCVAFGAANRVVVTGSWDGTVKLWGLPSGKLMATILILPRTGRDGRSREWLAYTPGGHWDGSRTAPEFIRWRLGERVKADSGLTSASHRPGILGAVLRAPR